LNEGLENNMKKLLLWCCIIVFLVFSIGTAYSAEVATFEAFYKKSSVIGWIVFAAFAIIAAATIYFTVGTASPIVTTIGTWIGNIAGLSGIAATNYGLALLGGGSIASGGFGIAGGMALLTLALEFSTGIAIDYAVNEIDSRYSYSKFVEQSKKMITLPLPQNDYGPDMYEEVFENLDKINSEEGYASNYNQQIIQNAILRMDSFSMNELRDNRERIKVNSLYALLYFLVYDYHRAKEYADISIRLARIEQIKRSLPAFIFAVSSLYEDKFDFNDITENYFRYSVLAEPDNKLIPLMFAVYLDRLIGRYQDGSLNESAFRKVLYIADEDSIKEYLPTNLTLVLARYFMGLKINQQRISSLCGSENSTIKKSEKTLTRVKNSLSDYDLFLEGTNNIVRYLLQPDLKLKDEVKQKIQEFYTVANKYTSDRERLNNMIISLENYQKTLSLKNRTNENVSSSIQNDDTGDDIILYVFIFIFFIFIVLLPFTRNVKKEKIKIADLSKESAQQIDDKKENIFIRSIKFLFRIIGSIILISPIAFGLYGLSTLSDTDDIFVGIVVFLLFSAIPFLFLVDLWKKKKSKG